MKEPQNKGPAKENSSPRARNSAFEQSIRFLKSKDYSEAELRIKLLGRHFDETEIEETVARLKNIQYLNDTRLIESLVKRELANGKSQKVIARLLIKRKLNNVGCSNTNLPNKITSDEETFLDDHSIEVSRKPTKVIKELFDSLKESDQIQISETKDKIVRKLCQKAKNRAGNFLSYKQKACRAIASKGIAADWSEIQSFDALIQEVWSENTTEDFKIDSF